MVRGTPLNKWEKMEMFLKITANTQTAVAECGAGQAFKRYYFAVKNHNGM